MFSSLIERCLRASPIGVALVLMLAPIAPLDAASTLSSYAIVHDDGTLTIRKRRIRLHGIYIPDTPRSCSRVMRPVRCGSRAANALDFKIHGFVECRPLYRHRDRSISAVCYNGGHDLGAYLIDRGWAVASPDAPFEYMVIERIARHNHRGIWGFSADVIQ